MTANERASEREHEKERGRRGGEAGPRCTCVRVRVTSEFLTVHWEEIIREWVKPWVTPPGRGGVERVVGGRGREVKERRRGEAGAKRAAAAVATVGGGRRGGLREEDEAVRALAL